MNALYDRLMALRLQAAEFADEAADNSSGPTSAFEARERGRAGAFFEAAEIVKTAGGPSDWHQADLSELLRILGLGDHARPQSPHEIFEHALSYLRGRLLLAAEARAALDDLFQAVSCHGAFVPDEPMDRADRFFRWERSFYSDWHDEEES